MDSADIDEVNIFVPVIIYLVSKNIFSKRLISFSNKLLFNTSSAKTLKGFASNPEKYLPIFQNFVDV